MQSEGGEITHLFRTNSFSRLYPARRTDSKTVRQTGGEAERLKERNGEEGTTLNSVNRKVQSEIKKTAAAKNCR